MTMRTLHRAYSTACDARLTTERLHDSLIGRGGDERGDDAAAYLGVLTAALREIESDLERDIDALETAELAERGG